MKRWLKGSLQHIFIIISSLGSMVAVTTSYVYSLQWRKAKTTEFEIIEKIVNAVFAECAGLILLV